jgi:hemerythrin
MNTATVLFPWREQYSVHVPQIDDQHRTLIRLINDLHSAMAQGKGRDVMTAILNDLVRYTDSHFASEEGWLERKGYSRLAEHRQIHAELRRQVVELRQKFQTGSLAITMEVMQFLKNWLRGHILEKDMAYSRELNATAVVC